MANTTKKTIFKELNLVHLAAQLGASWEQALSYLATFLLQRSFAFCLILLTK